MTTNGRGPGNNHGDDRGAIGHVVSVKMLVGVWAALMVLTVVTVAVAQVDLGSGSFHIAMVIATVKAALVALIFMHLRWDRGFHGFIFLGALAFVFLFISLSMLDVSENRPDIDELRQATEVTTTP